MSNVDFGTKNLPFREGYPTPAALPDTTACRVFRIPADDTNGSWQATFMGLISVLSDPANWIQQDGGLDADTCAERWQAMIDNAYDTAEAGCAVTLPDGSRVIRLNPTTGHVEELGEDSTWDAPTGDYALPPIPARSGGTPDDQNCLAAANAANVFSMVYESITDSIAHGLTAAEAYLAAATALVVVTAPEFAPIAVGLAVFFLVAFTAAYEVIQFLTPDLWDDAFTKQFVCLLVGCASNDAGVVTFDYNCFINALAAGTNLFDLSADQLRLFGQIAFILNALGGADALDQAGATTAISAYDCSDCAETWLICRLGGNGFDNMATANWAIFSDYCTATYNSGLDEVDGCAQNSGANYQFVIQINFPSPQQITEVSLQYATDNSASSVHVGQIYLFDAVDGYNGSGSVIGSAYSNNDSDTLFYSTLTSGVMSIWVMANAYGASYAKATTVCVSGTGANPFA